MHELYFFNDVLDAPSRLYRPLASVDKLVTKPFKNSTEATYYPPLKGMLELG